MVGMITNISDRKGTNKRAKYQRKTRFSLYFQARVPYLKVRISEDNI